MLLAIDDARIDVADAGNGPALVLLHGFGSSQAVWDAQAAALSGSVRVIRPDLRGHGASSVPPGPYLMERLAGDLAEVLDALGVEHAIVAGHSLGGYVTFAFYRLFAERCLGLGFVCTRASEDDPPELAARLALADAVERDGIAPAVEAYLPRLFAPEAYVERPAIVAATRERLERTDARGAAAMLRGMAARVGSEDLFEEVDVPTAVLAGARDAVVPPARSHAIAAGIRGALLDVVDCGHMAPAEAPEAVTAMLERLVASAAAAV